MSRVNSAYPGMFSDLRSFNTPQSFAATGTTAKASDDRTPLQNAAQLAIQVEFTTIPIYLTSLYSIKDLESNEYQTLRSVVIEEMFHVNQACNILVALGGTPRFTGKFAPSYPGYLPNANPGATPKLVLARASRDVFGNMFAGIETPAAPLAPPQGDNYDTIAQLYAALTDAVERAPGNPFVNGGPGRQRTDIYLGKFGGNIVEVVDKESFKEAVHQIIRQGEGAAPLDRPLVRRERYGAYNYYGQRTDGTYGPILGTPYELSHFVKFRDIALSTAAFPDTWPIVSDPVLTSYSNNTALMTAKAFNDAYSVMLRNFERSFIAADADPYFDVVLNLMHRVLPQLARSLMATPVFDDGDQAVGPNATPTWTYVKEARLSRLPDSLNQAASAAKAAAGNMVRPQDVTLPLHQAQVGLDAIMRAAPADAD